MDASLNERGVRQAWDTFRYFKDKKIDQLYASCLKRAHETLSPFGRSFTSLEGFDEISWGALEGMKATATEKNSYREVVKAWREGKLDCAIGGGETPLQVMERQKAAIKQVIEGDGQTLLICMHGRAMRILLCALLNYPLNYMDGFPHTNCSFYSLQCVGDLFSIKDFNYTAHLKSGLLPTIRPMRTSRQRFPFSRTDESIAGLIGVSPGTVLRNSAHFLSTPDPTCRSSFITKFYNFCYICEKYSGVGKPLETHKKRR